LTKFYYKTNIPIQANKDYKLKVIFKKNRNIKIVNSKYGIILKPSIYPNTKQGFIEANNNNHLYYLDLGLILQIDNLNLNHLNVSLVSYWSFNETSEML